MSLRGSEHGDVAVSFPVGEHTIEERLYLGNTHETAVIDQDDTDVVILPNTYLKRQTITSKKNLFQIEL